MHVLGLETDTIRKIRKNLATQWTGTWRLPIRFSVGTGGTIWKIRKKLVTRWTGTWRLPIRFSVGTGGTIRKHGEDISAIGKKKQDLHNCKLTHRCNT
jgi:hypothetical protein